MANEQHLVQSISNPLKGHLQLNHVFHFILFAIGMSFGMVACLYIRSFSITLHATLYSVSSPILQSPESPPLSSSPPPPQPPLRFSSLRPGAQPSPPSPPSPSPQVLLQSIEILSFETNKTSNYTSIISMKEHALLRHNKSDQELLQKASKAPMMDQGNSSYKIVPKVAFMFLTYGPIPLAPLWEKFFEGHEGFYSIYVHPHPSYNDSWPESSIFYGRRIPSQPVYWGTGTMIDAERRLLATALLDISNQRFVLLSESCIPLFGFRATYNYLMRSNVSFLGSFDDPRKPGRGRYNPRMWPIINITDWRKGSQWFELHRDLAVRIVSDQKYYQVFQDHCQPPCYMDEFYISTLVHMLYPERNSNRSLTWVDWSRGGPHPAKFGWFDITDEFLNQIRYGSECVYNGNTTTICFLFARKFLPQALEPLLRVAPLLLGLDP